MHRTGGVARWGSMLRAVPDAHSVTTLRTTASSFMVPCGTGFFVFVINPDSDFRYSVTVASGMNRSCMRHIASRRPMRIADKRRSG